MPGRIGHVLRLFLLRSSRNTRTLDGLGFFFVLAPLLRRLPEGPSRIEAAKRHLSYFNANQYTASYIAGAVANLERRRMAGEAVDPSLILRLKETLSSVLSSRGDYFFFVVLMPLGLTIGVIFAIYGSYIGLVLFLVLYNFFHAQSRIAGFITGERLGEEVAGRIATGLFEGQGFLGGCAAFVSGAFAALALRRAYGAGGLPIAAWGVAVALLGMALQRKFSFYWCVMTIFLATALFLAAAARI